MDRAHHENSIFSQKLDRVAFIAYFLGAVVPLLGLGIVVQRYALPGISDGYLQSTLIGAVGFAGVLSLSSFFILRRSTRQSLERMDADNHRLVTLFDASSSLAAACDGHDAATTAVRCALEATGARATFVLMRGEKGGPLELQASCGEEAVKLFQAKGDEILELAKMALVEGRPAVRGGDAEARMMPAAAIPIPGDVIAMGVLAAVHDRANKRFDAEPLNALSTIAGLASVALRNADLRDAQRNFFTHVTDILVTALDEHLGYNRGHGHRVAQLSNRMGREMGFDDHRMQRLHFAALLHDIGMLKFDRSLHKDAKSCEKHAVLGYRMLNRIKLWQDIAPVVHHHHEWFDGSGYPEGLAGEAIPLEARVIALCDAWDTMTSSASYKIALSFDDALRELRQGSGTQFDPQAVTAFLSLVEKRAITADDAG